MQIIRILGLMGISLMIAGISEGGFAQGLSGERDFTFKRIKVGESGKRKIVQIDPAEQARLLALAPKVKQRSRPTEEDTPVAAAAPSPTEMNPEALAPIEDKKAKYDWFWLNVPTSRRAPDRFPLALANLTKGPNGAQVEAPRLQYMQELAAKHGKDILIATIGTNVSPALALAVMSVESAGKVDAVSKAGAQGLMQLIPDTAERFGVEDLIDPAQNIKGGVAYLDWLMKRFSSDPVLVLSAYNAGEGAVDANDGVPPFAETRDYVPKVLAAWQVAQGLCLTPPELVSDPCVFKVISAGG